MSKHVETRLNTGMKGFLSGGSSVMVEHRKGGCLVGISVSCDLPKEKL